MRKGQHGRMLNNSLIKFMEMKFLLLKSWQKKLDIPPLDYEISEEACLERLKKE